MIEDLDLLVEGTVITMDPQRRVLAEGAVGVSGTRIVAVGTAAELRAAYRPARTLGGPRRFVIPGLIDCHNHLAQTLVREFGFEDLPNVFRVYIPAERLMSAQDARASALLGIAQLLRAGVTTVAETTSTAGHEQVIAETVLATGIRCALARGQGDRQVSFASSYAQISQRSSYRDDPARQKDVLAGIEDFLRTWSRPGRDRIRPWIHGGSVASCSDAQILRLAELAEAYDSGVMYHVNRDREEIELSVALIRRRPIEQLNVIGALSDRLLCIHAMLTTHREIHLLAAAGASVAHAPVVCNDLMTAVTEVPAMRAAGIPVGLACDTVLNDILAVMRTAVTVHNQHTGVPLFDPASFTCDDAFTMGTIEGARALRWDHEIGSLEVGKAADIVIVNGDNTRLTPTRDPITALVRFGLSSDVESVVVAGELLLEGGSLLSISEPEVIDAAVEVSAKFGADLDARRYRPLSHDMLAR